MRKEKNPLLLVDLPEYVIQNYMINDDLSVHQQARRALEKALPRYFDKKGNFTRLTVSFPFRMYEVDDKKGKGSETFRRLTFCVTKEILDQGAVSEVIGHYFDKEGKEIYVAPSSGISLQDFLKIPIVIGVCGGVEKAEAIVSISNLRKDMVLVIDESAANCILNTRR